MTQQYYIVSWANNDLVLGIKRNSTESGAEVVLQGYHSGSRSQLWTKEIRYQGGWFVLKNVNSGLVLDISGGEKSGHKLIQYWENRGSNQVWNYYQYDHTLRSYYKELCVDVSRANIVDGAKMIAYRHHGGSNQGWDLVEQEEREGRRQIIYNRYDNSRNFINVRMNDMHNTMNNNVRCSIG